MSEFLEAALQYAGRGWRVFPLKPRGKTPILKGGFKLATVAPSQLEAWWGAWPDANVGIATGLASNLIVYDLDGIKGLAYARQLEQQLGPLPPTYAVRTGKGWHLYYELDARHSIPGCSAGDGLDVRCEGGYTVAPPSIHPNGKRYEWLAGLSALADFAP